MEKLGINLGYLLVQICNFAVIFIVLRAWVYKPLLNMLAKRRETITKGLEDARVASEARASAEEQANKIVADAQRKAEEIVRETSERVKGLERQMLADAEADAAKRREQTLVEMDVERNRMFTELRAQVGSLAIAATQKLLQESLDEKRQQVLLDEFFSGVRAGRVVVLEGAQSLEGTSVEVVSALPLTVEEQKKIRVDVLSKSQVVDKEPEFTFKVDPSLLGGLVVRVGDRVVDGSVAGQLESLRRSF